MLNYGKKMLSGRLFGQRVPALCAEGDFGAVACHHDTSESLFCDMAYDFHAFHLFDFLQIAERNGEE